MRLGLASLVLVAATTYACIVPYSFVAPTPTPDYVAGAVSPHSVWIRRAGRPTTVTCTENPAGGICAQGVRFALDEGLHEVLNRLATPAQSGDTAEFVAEIGHLGLGDAYGRDGYHLELEWAFELRDRSGRLIVSLHDTQSTLMPTQGLPVGPGVERTFLRLENAALQRIDDAVVRSAIMH